MTTIDPLALPHIRGLCRAIDAGDDSVLPILADALEEMGLGRPDEWCLSLFFDAGMERIGWHAPYRIDHAVACRLVAADGWSWYKHGVGARSSCATRTHTTLEYARSEAEDADWIVVCYTTRSAAYLALAATLTEMR